MCYLVVGSAIKGGEIDKNRVVVGEFHMFSQWPGFAVAP